MSALVGTLLVWMPLPFKLIALGVVAIFFVFTVLHIVRFIMELIPFL